jgi:mannose/fructose/N-acetylgalactosamine-specific phosphotransferase system component IID
MEVFVSGVNSTVEKNPENANMINTGIINKIKCPAVILIAGISDKYFLIIFTLKAYPKEAVRTKIVYQ